MEGIFKEDGKHQRKSVEIEVAYRPINKQLILVIFDQFDVRFLFFRNLIYKGNQKALPQKQAAFKLMHCKLSAIHYQVGIVVRQGKDKKIKRRRVVESREKFSSASADKI